MATAIDENSGAGQVVYDRQRCRSGDRRRPDRSGRLRPRRRSTLPPSRSITSTGEVTLIGDPDYEAHASGYSFTVTATDAAEQHTTTRDGDAGDQQPRRGCADDHVWRNGDRDQREQRRRPDRLHGRCRPTSATSAAAYSFSLKAGDDAAAFTIDADYRRGDAARQPELRRQASYSFTVMAADTAGHFAEQR